MKNCLSGAPELAGNSQQQKMKSCNTEAGKQNLSGDARKDFMKSCLSAN
nr:PsiF family protein [Methylobacillus flagellatus]